MRVSAFAFLQFCAFRNPQIRPKSPYLGNLDSFKQPKMVKIQRNWLFLLFPEPAKYAKKTGPRKTGQKALILAILENFGKHKMVTKNLQFSIFRNPQNRPKCPYFCHFGEFWESQNGQKSRKSAIWGFPESAKQAKKPLVLQFWKILGSPQ